MALTVAVLVLGVVLSLELVDRDLGQDGEAVLVVEFGVRQLVRPVQDGRVVGCNKVRLVRRGFTYGEAGGPKGLPHFDLN